MKNLSERNKLILIGLFLSVILIIFCAYFALDGIQKRIYESYSNFGQLITKTIAVQSSDLMEKNKKDEIENFASSLISQNREITYILYKDKDGNDFYKSQNEKQAKYSSISVNSPIRKQNGVIIGSVEIGLSASTAQSVTGAVKNVIFVVFVTAWLIFAFILLINAFLMTRELAILGDGVQEITSGKFGTVIKYGDVSAETKKLFDAFNDMSKRLHRYEEQNIDTLTVEKSKLEAVLMGIVNGVIVCDDYDKISIVNNAALEILNTKIYEILGTQIQNYSDIEGEICFRDKIEVFKSTPLEEMEKKPLEFSVNIDKKVVKTTISPLYSKDHDYMGYILILTDITREAEVDRLKSDFISNVSHELRTPVTVLRTYIDTLYSLGNEFSYDEQKEFIGTINQEIIRLNKMVNDILDFSRLESDQMYEKTKGNLPNFVENIVNNLKVLAENKQVQFVISREENLPEIMFSEEALERVLNNLISNALKYSPNNSQILVNTKMSEDKKYLITTVQDFGCGISKEHLNKIFDRFYRVENSTHTVKGTGLGLYLVKVAIEKHHKGKVFAQSTPNEGSTFGFMLPIEVVEEENQADNEHKLEV